MYGLADHQTNNMKPVEFPEQNIIIAENQADYINLPALVIPDEYHHVISCWELSDEEIERIKETKKTLG